MNRNISERGKVSLTDQIRRASRSVATKSVRATEETIPEEFVAKVADAM